MADAVDQVVGFSTPAVVETVLHRGVKATQLTLVGI